MKKKTAVAVICTILALILLIPLPMRLSDGGSTEYHALLYSVTDVHQLAPAEAEKEFEEGIIVEILGFKVFNNVR